jgi:hypothetical protein
MFLGLLDLDPDPLVSGMDPYPDPSIMKQKKEKNLDSYFYVTFFKNVNVNYINIVMYLQKVISRKTFFKLAFYWLIEG